MITLFQTSTVYPLTEIKSAMARQLKPLPNMISATGDPLQILRYELGCEPIDGLTWLHNQTISTKIYWSNRDGSFQTSGLGRSVILSETNLKQVLESIEDSLSSDNNRLRYFGGMAFDGVNDTDDWSLFPEKYFCIPQFELYEDNGKHIFAVNIALKDLSEEYILKVLSELDAIDFSASTEYRGAPKVKSRNDFPEREEWDDIFNATIENIANKQFQKVVLARKSVFKFDRAIDPIALLKHVKDITPDCYHFCFQMEAYQGFIGASPECLYKRSGRSIETEALAGTKPRGKTPTEDAQLAEDLLKSSKNNQEHRFVVDNIQETLKRLCETSDQSGQTELLKLKGYQHLITRFAGSLKSDIDDSTVIEALHPTPAMAGLPKKEVMTFIANQEPFNRGWYAAPVGYVGYDHAEFSVAIRSALITGDKLSLFAGAGIVEGSTAGDEWDEVEGKICNFIKVFDQ